MLSSHRSREHHRRWIWVLLCAALALSLAPPPAAAAPLQQNTGRVGSAPIDPPPPLDVDESGKRALENFSVDTGQPSLDTACSEGNLSIDVPIGRYIGPTDGQGRLANVQALIDANVVARYATLVMPVFDIDSDSGEVDHVFVNGQQLLTRSNSFVKLTGSDSQWSVNTFEVPIELLRFPGARGAFATGSTPTPITNTIRIDIDVTNAGWCMAVDWVALQVNAIAPLVLIHGISANQEAWTNATETLADQVPPAPGVPRESARDYLARLGVPFEWEISLPAPNGNVAGNSADVRDAVLRAARSFGTGKIHLVAHSKGGLDSRGYLAWRYDSSQVRVLTLHTISTPHRGSVLANYSAFTRRHPNVVRSADPDIQGYLRGDPFVQLSAATGGPGPRLPGLGDLTTSFVADFNRRTRGTLPRGFYSYGADANVRNAGGNPIDAGEATPFFNRAGLFKQNRGSLAYRLLRDQATMRVEERRETIYTADGIPLEVDRLYILEALSQSPQFNDLVVTTTSAWLGFEPHADVDGNHQNIKDGLMFRRILDNINCSFPVGPQRAAAPCT